MPSPHPEGTPPGPCPLQPHTRCALTAPRRLGMAGLRTRCAGWCGRQSRGPGLTSALGLQPVEQVSPGEVLEKVVVAVVHGAKVPGHRVGTCKGRAQRQGAGLPRSPAAPAPPRGAGGGSGAGPGTPCRAAGARHQGPRGGPGSPPGPLLSGGLTVTGLSPHKLCEPKYKQYDCTGLVTNSYFSFLTREIKVGIKSP